MEVEKSSTAVFRPVPGGSWKGAAGDVSVSRPDDPTAPRQPHGDDHQLVMVVEPPPPSAPVADADIAPPRPVLDSEPRVRISRG